MQKLKQEEEDAKKSMLLQATRENRENPIHTSHDMWEFICVTASFFTVFVIMVLFGVVEALINVSPFLSEDFNDNAVTVPLPDASI